MAGGSMNITAVGESNMFIHGDPLSNTRKTFFSSAYARHTNFGLQKFRLDFDGSRDLRITEPSEYIFKVSKYADLLMDAYLCFTLPNIWSPIYPPEGLSREEESGPTLTGNQWAPYEFKWIENIGSMLIKEVEIQCGSYTLAKYSGAYISAMAGRDFTTDKKRAFDHMTGNIEELNRPEYAFGRINTYPSAFKSVNTPTTGTEPSIRGRQLQIPLNGWFSMRSQSAFPMLSLNTGVELTIKVTLRPIQDLFRVRDVFDSVNYFPHIRPDFNRAEFQMHRFLQSPPASLLSIYPNPYENTMNTWNADIHIIATYAFLSPEEAAVKRLGNNLYLIKDVLTYTKNNITGTTRMPLTSNGMITSWMWFFQRSDAFLRNEWSNYTNWPYKQLPANIINARNVESEVANYNPSLNPSDNSNTGIFLTGDFSPDNRREIMATMGVLLNGAYREDPHVAPQFDAVEKYARSPGFESNGVYCYNFCLDTTPFVHQPSGAINLTEFKTVELEVTTFVPQIDTENSTFNVLCDANGGGVISTRQSNWRLYEYAYDLTVFEERYNILYVNAGTVSMLYAR
jgi:hypothetical protein